MKVLINTQERFLKNHHNYIYWIFREKEKEKNNWTRWHSRNTQHTEFYKLLHNSTNSTLSHYTLNNIKFVLEQPNCNPPPPSHPDTLIDPQKKKNVPMDLSPSFCFLFFSFYFFIIPCPVCNKAHNRNPSPDLIYMYCFVQFTYLALSVTEYTSRNPSPDLIYCSLMAQNSSWPAVSKTAVPKKKKCKFMSY